MRRMRISLSRVARSSVGAHNHTKLRLEMLASDVLTSMFINSLPSHILECMYATDAQTPNREQRLSHPVEG